MTPAPCTGPLPALGVVLAGGRGQRMGGADKGLLRWRGQAMAAWVLAALRPQVAALALNANRHLDEYRALGVPVFSDAEPHAFNGPLAGLLAALRHATPAHDWVLTAPCDSPALPQGLGPALWLARGAACAVLPRTPDGHLHPTHVLAHTGLIQPLAEHLAQPGPRHAAQWLLAHGAAVLDWPTALPGFNTPEELASAAPPPL